MSRAYGRIDFAAKRRIMRAFRARLRLTNKALAAGLGVSEGAISSVIARERAKEGM